jgi:hypothetical protein
MAIEHKAHGSASRWVERVPRRHPCEVTADRLLDHLERYPEKFDGKARDAIGEIRFLLQEIAGSIAW